MTEVLTKLLKRLLSNQKPMPFQRSTKLKKMFTDAPITLIMVSRAASIGVSRVHKIISDLNYFSEIPFEYQGDGLDDFEKYQRPSSNGVGYVAICPGERGNNYYVDDPVTVKILRRRYDEWKMKQTE